MTGITTSRHGLVVMGASLGGLSALPVVVGALPADFPLPIVVVQHRSTVSGFSALASVLQRSCLLDLRDVMDKDPLVPGRVYLAPPDYHTLVDDDHLALSTEARVQYARPSIDVLFLSAAESYGPRTIAVVLTGANRDGVVGSRRIKQRGGVVLVQDPATAESAVLPSAVLATVPVDRVVPLTDLGALLVQYGRASASSPPPAAGPGSGPRSPPRGGARTPG